MALRQYDFEHESCGGTQTELVQVPSETCSACDGKGRDRDGEDCRPCRGTRSVPGTPARSYELDCKACGAKGVRMRRVMSAPAAYTYDKPFFPLVHGGTYDTAGYRNPPPMPPLPTVKAYDEIRDHVRSKPHQEQARERWNVMQQNAMKKKRAAAMKAGAPGVDLRTHPLPGDPPLDRVASKPRKRKI